MLASSYIQCIPVKAQFTLILTTLYNSYLTVSCFIKLIEHLLYIIYAINTVIPYKIYSNKTLNNIFRFWLCIACKTWFCWET